MSAPANTTSATAKTDDTSGSKLRRRGGLRRRPGQNDYLDRRQPSPAKLPCQRTTAASKPLVNGLSFATEASTKAPLVSAPVSQPLKSTTSSTIASDLQNSETVIIKDTGTRCGRGIFVTGNFAKGHRIIREEPIVSCVHWSGRKTIAEEWVRLPKASREELKSRFWKKLNDIPISQELKPQHKLQLQSFVKEYAFWDPQREKAHVYILASHINHACTSCANAQQWTDSQWPNRIAVTLVKPLKAGDEVFINYNRANLPFGCAVCGPPGLMAHVKAFGNSIFR